MDLAGFGMEANFGLHLYPTYDFYPDYHWNSYIIILMCIIQNVKMNAFMKLYLN